MWLKFSLHTLQVILIVASVISRPFLSAQELPSSPVFKSYRTPGLGALVVQSDATYQMWQTFQLTQKANAGDALAQHELGIRYLIGRGVQADTAKGAYWTLKAAAQQLLPARFNHGILLQNGWGVEWSPFKAYEEFAWCAERGMPEAQYAMAQFLTDNIIVPRNRAEAYKWVKAAADSGFEPAKEVLPDFIKRGYGVDSSSVLPVIHSPSLQPRLQWTPVFLDFDADTLSKVQDGTLLKDLLREASPALQQALGNQTTDTSLVMDSVAIQFVNRAANAGSPEALVVLGRCYEKGIFVEKSAVKAIMFYVQAVRFDSPHARELLWTVLEHQPSVATLKAHAARGDQDAMFSLAALAALGLQHPLLSSQSAVTEAQALELLESSSKTGHIPSMIELGLCHFSGRWVKEDRIRALSIWSDAEHLGSLDAAVRVAATLVINSRIASDSLVETLQTGIKEGSVLAQVAVGYCFEHGVGVERRKGEAARWYRIAASRGSQDGYRALIRLHDEIRPEEVRYRITD